MHLGRLSRSLEQNMAFGLSFLANAEIFCKRIMGGSGSKCARKAGQMSCGAFHQLQPEVFPLTFQNPLDVFFTTGSDIDPDQSQAGVLGAHNGDSFVSLEKITQVMNLRRRDETTSEAAF